MNWILHQSGMRGSSSIAYGNGEFLEVGGDGILGSGTSITLAASRSAVTGLLTLSLTGQTGIASTVETSTDLIACRNFTNIIGVQPTNVILDAFPSASDHLFYRAYSQ